MQPHHIYECSYKVRYRDLYPSNMKAAAEVHGFMNMLLRVLRGEVNHDDKVVAVSSALFCAEAASSTEYYRMLDLMG